MLEVLYILIALGFTIFVHELGHFVSAKIMGMRVESFSMGFGPKVAGFKKGETEYRISLLFFLGGYVKLGGENPEELDKGDTRAFLNQHPFKRIIVGAAGVTQNFIFAIILMWVVFLAGTETLGPEIGKVMKDYPAAGAGLKKGDRIVSINGEKISYWDQISEAMQKNAEGEITVKVERNGSLKEYKLTPVIEEAEDILKEKKKKPFMGISPLVYLPVIDGFVEGYPAENSGLKEGDVIKEFNGRKVKYWDDFIEMSKDAGNKEAVITVDRKGGSVDFRIKPKMEETEDEAGEKVTRPLFGINPKPNTVIERYGFFKAGQMGVDKTIYFTVITVKAIYKMITRKIEPDVAGPIGVMHITYKVAKTGVVNLLLLLAVININLVIVNLLPILPFDGGLILVFLIEWVTGKAVPLKVQSALIQIGWGLLIFLLFFLTYTDIMRLVHGGP